VSEGDSYGERHKPCTALVLIQGMPSTLAVTSNARGRMRCLMEENNAGKGKPAHRDGQSHGFVC